MARHGLKNLVGLEVELHGVVDLDVRVSVAEGAAVVRHEVWHVLGGSALLDDLAQLDLHDHQTQIEVKKNILSNTTQHSIAQRIHTTPQHKSASMGGKSVTKDGFLIRVFQGL